MSDKPIFRNTSRVVVVDGRLGAEPRRIEVRTEEMLSKKTGRYRKQWAARLHGSLGWHGGSTARMAIARAAIVREGKRPEWLAAAAAAAEGQLGAGRSKGQS